MNRSFQNHSFPQSKFSVSRCFLLLVFLALPGVAWSYTADDLAKAKAKDDIVLLEIIADDEATDNAVRAEALQALPASQQGAYFNSPLFRANPGIQANLVANAAIADGFSLDAFPDLLRFAVESGKANVLAAVQSSYIRKLIEAERSGEAVSESKRLLGITPLDADALFNSLSTVAAAIKADALTKGKTSLEAVGEANAYLEAVNKGDVRGHAHTALAYPATSEELSALATDARPEVAIMALLYAGRYDDAKIKADILRAKAADNSGLVQAARFAGAALNGKAGLPTAANVLLQPDAAMAQPDAEVFAPIVLHAELERRIIDDYAAGGDERAESYYKAVLAEIEKQGPQPREVFEVRKLADFYRITRQRAKVAELLSRMERYTTDAALIANGLVEAGRYYREAGDEAKANEMYGKASATPGEWGWARGMALLDQADDLMGQGQHEEARKLLSTPVTGTHAEQIKVALLSFLGYSYYRSGDYKNARRYSQEAIDQAEAITLLTGHGLENRVGTARDTISWIEQWSKQPATPFICAPSRVDHAVEPWQKHEEPLTGQLMVRAARPLTVKVVSESPLVQVEPIDNEAMQDVGFFQEKMFLFKIAPEALKQNFSTVLIVTSPQAPGYELRVPLTLEQKTGEE